MRRREFIALLGGTAVSPVAASAQQARTLPTVGFLGASTPANWTHWTNAFVRRLGELGWTDGRTVAIEYRWAEGRSERVAEIAAEFVRLKVDIIVTVGSAALAAKQVTSTIPIVFAAATDPLGGGLVASLARPGGNATGLSMQASDAAGKRLELLREVFPGLRRVAIIGNAGYPAVVQEIAEARTAARTLGLDLDVLEIHRADDIPGTFPALKAGPQALYVCADPLVNANHARINTLALGARLPTMHPVRDFLGAGGFMSYGPSLVHSFQRAADYADKILRGAKPSDLPVEQPTKLDLVFNLTAARALEVEISPTLLARADPLAAKAATATIPIVFTSGLDPVQIGLVASFNRPGGNATGVALLSTELGPKRLGLLRELLLPKPGTIAFVVNPNNAATPFQVKEMQAAAQAVGQPLLVVEAGTETQIDQAFAMMAERNVAAILYAANLYFQVVSDRLVALAARYRIPALYEWREFVTAGGLMSYSSDRNEFGRMAGSYTGRILKGEKPADLPVVQSARFELVINLRTAKALDLPIPPTLLARADEVIE